MKKLVLLSFCVLFSAAIANAGIFRVGEKVVARSAKLGAKAVKPVVQASAKSAKWSSKKATYPLRHPVKSAKKSASAVKKVAY